MSDDAQIGDAAVATLEDINRSKPPAEVNERLRFDRKFQLQKVTSARHKRSVTLANRVAHLPSLVDLEELTKLLLSSAPFSIDKKTPSKYRSTRNPRLRNLSIIDVHEVRSTTITTRASQGGRKARNLPISRIHLPLLGPPALAVRSPTRIRISRNT